MARSFTQSTSIYLVSLSIILLGYNNLQACPLPSNASCTECQVLRYIQLNHSRQLNVNLTVTLDLLHSQNNPNDFSDAINPDNRHDFSFEPYAVGSVESCLGSDPNTGSPCTHNIRMEGDNLPSCQWDYTCDYSPNRFPQYLWRAQCTGAAQPIIYHIPTLTLESAREGDCLPFAGTQAVYRWQLEKVAVACTI